MSNSDTKLVSSVRSVYEWATRRIKGLEKEGEHQSAQALKAELYEWLYAKNNAEHEIYSFEVI